jgi:hypothetical protein
LSRSPSKRRADFHQFRQVIRNPVFLVDLSHARTYHRLAG